MKSLVPLNFAYQPLNVYPDLVGVGKSVINVPYVTFFDDTAEPPLESNVTVWAWSTQSADTKISLAKS